MKIIVDVNKPTGKGAGQFISDLPQLMKDSKSFEVTKSGLKATLKKKPPMTSLPEPPEFLVEESSGGAGSVMITQTNGKTWDAEQRVRAIEPLIYLLAEVLTAAATTPIAAVKYGNPDSSAGAADARGFLARTGAARVPTDWGRFFFLVAEARAEAAVFVAPFGDLVEAAFFAFFFGWFAMHSLRCPTV